MWAPGTLRIIPPPCLPGLAGTGPFPLRRHGDSQTLLQHELGALRRALT